MPLYPKQEPPYYQNGTAITTKIYAASLEQAGTSAPTVTVHYSTLDGNVVWTRISPGEYRGTLANAFPAPNTYIPPFGRWEGAATTFLPISDAATILGYYTISYDYTGSDYILLYVLNSSFTPVDLSTLTGGTLDLPLITIYP